MNGWDILLIFAIAAIVVLAIIQIIKAKKKGNGCMRGSCENCQNSSCCRKSQDR